MPFRPLGSILPNWTPSQTEALARARAFFAGEGEAFVLDGAAGTGKTTLVSAIVDAVPGHRAVHFVAPTARAARVLREKTGFPARTLHSHLYTVEPVKDKPALRCIPKPNNDDAPTLLVVDEASMVSSRKTSEDLFVADRSLLADLLAHVRSGPQGSQVLFVGDPRQLPPVGEDVSTALCADTLRRAHGLSVGEARLVEIVRQAEGSSVLDAAGRLRDALDSGGAMPDLDLPFLNRWPEAVPAFLDWTDGAKTPFEAVHLVYFNKTAKRFNDDVRRALGRFDDLCKGDLVTLDADAWVQVDAGNGQRSEVQIVRGTPYEVLDVGRERSTRADLTFCTATLRACGDPDAAAFTHRVCLSHLTTDAAGLTMEQIHALWADRMAKNQTFQDNPHPKNDEWVGALRLRFAYAMTVHKAQGSEWTKVQINPWVRPDDEGTRMHQRWLYTAITRAREAVYRC